MQFLNNDSRYGCPPDGHPAIKLGAGEWAIVRITGCFKGYIRVGKRAYSCIFLQRQDEQGWVYCSKSRFVELIMWADQHLGISPLAEKFILHYVQFHEPTPNRRKDASDALGPSGQLDFLRLDDPRVARCSVVNHARAQAVLRAPRA
jgi:hypothetical protein